jgi:type II secretory pathway pseudopilin PulG
MAVLFALALLGATAALTAVVSSVLERREREAQLLFVGGEYRRAIRAYYEANPKLPERYPKELSWLLRDPNQLETRRYLRQAYFDPLTGRDDWGLVRSPGGGIAGVYSRSERAPIKRAGFPDGLVFSGAKTYADWKFVFATGSVAAAGAADPTQAPTASASGGANASAVPGEPRVAKLREPCEILNGADQGYCRAMEVRYGAAAGTQCRGLAAQRQQICRTDQRGDYPPLMP